MSVVQRILPRWIYQKTALVAGLALLLAGPGWGEGYGSHPKAKAFVDQMVKDHGFERQQVQHWLTEAQKKQSILDAIARPAEKTKPWKDYRKIFLTTSRTQKGVEFWLQNREALARAEQTYGVPAEVIVAIIGVETRYGHYTGRYRVIDALSTLAFDYPKRARFFRKELAQFLLLAREQQQNPLDLKGSYAGAMGYGQFMPSSFRAYAVDFDNDALADIWANPTDAIGSVANYFHRHGWQGGRPVVLRAQAQPDYDRGVVNHSLKPRETLLSLAQKGFQHSADIRADELATAMRLEGQQGEEFWLGLSNFYVITRYNHSHLYAMAVHQLSQEIKQAYLHREEQS